jgi:hypothetical protein
MNPKLPFITTKKGSRRTIQDSFWRLRLEYLSTFTILNSIFHAIGDIIHHFLLRLHGVHPEKQLFIVDNISILFLEIFLQGSTINELDKTNINY